MKEKTILASKQPVHVYYDLYDLSVRENREMGVITDAAGDRSVAIKVTYFQGTFEEYILATRCPYISRDKFPALPEANVLCFDVHYYLLPLSNLLCHSTQEADYFDQEVMDAKTVLSLAGDFSKFT